MDNEKQITVLDPTSLTTQQLWREIGSLKELAFNEMNSIKAAIELAHENISRFPTEVDEKCGAIKELLKQEIIDLEKIINEKINAEHNLKETKFEKVDQRFELIETQRIEQKKDAEANVQTALSSARQLVEQQNNYNIIAANKTEAAFSKQMDQQENLTSSIEKGFYAQLEEVKKRLTTIEAMAIGALSQKNEHRENTTERREISNATWGIVATIAAILFGIIGLYVGNVLNK